RTSLKVRTPVGETTEERRSYDRYGRLVEIASFGVSVRYRYDAKGRVARQTVDGTPVDFVYTKYGRLAGKYLGGKERPDAAVEYEYAKSGRLVARTANGVRQTYEYDGRGQLLAVKEGGADVERYAYDKAGNMVRKSVRGKTTTFAFDGANQLVSSTCDGVTTRYAYDAAGRLVREGERTYRYGYLDKVMLVTEGKRTYAYAYHADGQLARADCGDGRAEDFDWDGLALVRRGDERFVNEPHIGGGTPVSSSKGTTYFNDVLGTTVGAKRGKAYSAAALTAFGETLAGDGAAPSTKHSAPSTFFTGKPQVDGLGRVFLFRNYRASLAKWQTADPLGYPDGWNQLAYCNNDVILAVDLRGACRIPRQGYEEDWTKFYANYTFGIKGYWTCNHNFYAPAIIGHWSENVEEGSRDVIADYDYEGYDAMLLFSTREKTNTFTLASMHDPFNHVYNLIIEVEVYLHVYYIDENGVEHSESMWDRPEILTLTSFHTITRQAE
ncbi:MAG: hypothetical protein ACI4RD_06695, partial [Kiritimatiellia bacterium]